MPRKMNKPAANTQSDLTFLSYRLSEAELADIDSRKVSAAQILTLLAEACENGLKFSLNYNAQRSQANATFIDQRPGSTAKGYALSAFGANCEDALKLLMYKHFDLLHEEWDSLLGVEPPKVSRG